MNEFIGSVLCSPCPEITGKMCTDVGSRLEVRGFSLLIFWNSESSPLHQGFYVLILEINDTQVRMTISDLSQEILSFNDLRVNGATKIRCASVFSDMK